MNSKIARRGAMTASGVCVLAMLAVPVGAGNEAAAPAAGTRDTLLDEGQRLFFSARYDAAAALMSAPCLEDQAAACEVRASALLFLMRRELGEAAGKKKAFEGCASCGELLSGFQRATERGCRPGPVKRPCGELDVATRGIRTAIPPYNADRNRISASRFRCCMTRRVDHGGGSSNRFDYRSGSSAPARQYATQRRSVPRSIRRRR